MTKKVRIVFLVAALMANSCSGINNQVPSTKTTVNSQADLSKKQTFLSAKDIADLEKEYSAFTTKSASQGYVRKKLDLWLDTANNGATIKGPQLLREVEFARIKGETEIPLKALFASVLPADLYNKVANASAITTAISLGNAPLDVFINVTVNPFPGVPSGLSADTITPNGFTARWSAVSGATAYEITINNNPAVNVPTGTSYVANITGTGHTFKVRAVKGLAAGNDSTAFNVPAIPATPGTLSADTITSAGFTARWAAVAGATSYEIMVNNTGPFNVPAGTSYTASVTGTGHKFKVRALNSTNSTTGDYSTEFNVPAIPGVPGTLSADTLTPVSFTARWGAVSGATGYEIKIDGNAPVSAGANTFYNATGLTGTSHSFQVRAINATAAGDYSNPTAVTLPIPTGLVLNLDAASNSSYPGSGTTWTDISGSGIGSNGTLVSGVGYSTGIAGLPSDNSLVFDGVDDYINLGVVPAVNNATTTFTMNMWFRTNNAAIEQMLFSTTDGVTGWHIELYTNKIILQIYPSGHYGFSNSALSSNTWYNVTVTYSDKIVKYYKNGVLDGTSTYPNAYTKSTNATYLGWWTTNTSFRFQGNIANTQFYNRVLNDTEVQQNFNAVKSRFGL